MASISLYKETGRAIGRDGRAAGEGRNKGSEREYKRITFNSESILMKPGEQLIFPVCEPNGEICVKGRLTLVLGQEGSEAGLKFLANHYLPLPVLDCQVFDSGAPIEVLVGGLSRGRRRVLRLLQVQVLQLLLLSVLLRLHLLLYLPGFLYHRLRLGGRHDLSLCPSRLQLVVQ